MLNKACLLIRVLLCFLFVFSLCMLSYFSRVRLFATLWPVALQAALSVGFSRQEYWNELPFPPHGNLPDPGIEPTSLPLLHWQASSLPPVPPGRPFQSLGEEQHDLGYAFLKCFIHFRMEITLKKRGKGNKYQLGPRSPLGYKINTRALTHKMMIIASTVVWYI